MKLYYSTEVASLPEVVFFDKANIRLTQFTLVLQHSSGALGFDREGGALILTALLGDSLIIETQPTPRSLLIPAENISSKTICGLGYPILVCSYPTSELKRELEKNAQNKRLQAQSIILQRHGQEAKPMAQTVFDDWLAADKCIKASVLAFCIGQSKCVSLWDFSDKGFYGRAFFSTSEEGEAWVQDRCHEIPLECQKVNEKDFPCW